MRFLHQVALDLVLDLLSGPLEWDLHFLALVELVDLLIGFLLDRLSLRIPSLFHDILEFFI